MFAHSPKIVTDGLVLALDAGNTKSYTFGSTTWYDISGKNNNGVLVNGPTFSGIRKQASIVFDGSNDYVTCGSSSATLNFTTDYTINMWLYYINDTTYGPMFSRYNIGVASSDIEVYVGNGGITTVHNRNNGGTFNYQILGFTNPYGIMNFTLVYTANTWTTYFNGAFGQTANTAFGGGPIYDPLYHSNYNNVLGAFYYGNLHGNIYTCDLYNRALSTTEITQNFNALRGRYGI